MNKIALKLGAPLFAILVIFVTWGTSSATYQDTPDDTALPNAAALPDNYLFLPSVFHTYPNDSIFGYEWSSISTSHGLNEMAEAGASWVRRAGIWWPDVEPTKGNYNWSALSGFEAEFIRARDNNMKVVIIVRGTPGWAQDDPPFNRECGRIKTSEFGSFANFTAELVRRYSGPPYYVKYWELGNEQEIAPDAVPLDRQWMGCWGNNITDVTDPNYEPLYGGGHYADMLKVVYPAMKAENPNIKVMIGGLLLDCDYNIFPNDLKCQTIKFFEGILANGGGPYFDGVSFHAYDYYGYTLGTYGHNGWDSFWNTTSSVLLAKADYLLNALSNYSVTGKFLMNTETAFLCNTEWGACDSDFETTKAYYVVHTYVAAMAKGLEANLWYFWMYRNSGLLEADLDPLPAYDAYKFARNELRDATYNQEITSYLPGIRVYELNNRGGRIWVLWSLDGATHTGFSLGGTPAAIYDVYGNPVTVSSSIDVGLMPLYIEWDT